MNGKMVVVQLCGCCSSSLGYYVGTNGVVVSRCPLGCIDSVLSIRYPGVFDDVDSQHIGWEKAENVVRD